MEALPYRRGFLVALDDYTKAKEQMFAATDTDDAPWTVVKSNDKRRGRLNAMRFVLASVDYADKDDGVVGIPDPLIVGRAASVYELGEQRRRVATKEWPVVDPSVTTRFHRGRRRIGAPSSRREAQRLSGDQIVDRVFLVDTKDHRLCPGGKPAGIHRVARELSRNHFESDGSDAGTSSRNTDTVSPSDVRRHLTSSQPASGVVAAMLPSPPW